MYTKVGKLLSYPQSRGVDMSSQWESIRKTRSQSSSQPSQQGLFRQHPFSEPFDNDEVSPHEQEVQDLHRHLDNESRFGYNFSRVKVSPYKPAIEPKFTFEPPTVQGATKPLQRLVYKAYGSQASLIK
ncbi:MAG TPA: hypothetical protein V6D30_23275 [Leptolyngbyaceae cyanobacterium]